MRQHWLDAWESEQDERSEVHTRSFVEAPNPLAEFTIKELLQELARRKPEVLAFAYEIVNADHNPKGE